MYKKLHAVNAMLYKQIHALKKQKLSVINYKHKTHTLAGSWKTKMSSAYFHA